MDCTSTRLPYRQTGVFSKLALDYIDQEAALKPFYTYPPSIEGVHKAIEKRKSFHTDRDLLVGELKKQYANIRIHKKTGENIDLLISENTYTITTAHQNNIFTGPLYFIYKIIHVIKLADHFNEVLPGCHFVPVFFIGSEDADLNELNHLWLGGEKLVWETKQTGAVGRMKVDKELLKLVDSMHGQLSVLPYGGEMISKIRKFYKEGITIQDATFAMVNDLFSEYGLVILLPDNAVYKKQLSLVFRDDLLQQTASGIVEETANNLQNAGYKVQANPREINLFYLKENLRERIEYSNANYRIKNSPILFNEKEILEELETHPERFSPNVILRGIFQETILPNILFVGGAGETAYWLQLKNLFEHYQVPFPVLVLRNSFLLIEKRWDERIKKSGFKSEDFFLDVQELMNRVVAKESNNETRLNGSLTELEQMYESFKRRAVKVDSSLEKHVESLKLKSILRLKELEKKMLRAEKRKFSDRQRQLQAIKDHLFPHNGLQERIDNFSYYYSIWGNSFIKQLYNHSLALEQEFVILEEK